MIDENDVLEILEKLKDMQTDLYTVLFCRPEQKDEIEKAFKRHVGGLVFACENNELEENKCLIIEDKALKRQILELNGLI